MSRAESDRRIVLAKSWRNRVAGGLPFLFMFAIFVGYIFTAKELASVIIASVAAPATLAGAVTCLRSGLVYVKGDRLTSTRVLWRDDTVRRNEIEDVVIRRSQFGNLPTMGRSVDLKLSNGKTLQIDIQVRDSKGPHRNVEGLAEAIRKWAAEGRTPA